MDDVIVKKALAYSLGADLHMAWCQRELYDFFVRAGQAFASLKDPNKALEAACYKGNDKRNEVELNNDYILTHSAQFAEALVDFNKFMELFKMGVIKVKRYTKRSLSTEEVKQMGSDYKDGKENILRDFSVISEASKADNLGAAIVAIELVYDKTISKDPITPEELEQMGAVVHEEWLKRNSWVFDPNYGNPALAVPYAQLTKEEQDKDKAQLYPAQSKVQAYTNGLVDIEYICSQYGISTSRKD